MMKLTLLSFVASVTAFAPSAHQQHKTSSALAALVNSKFENEIGVQAPVRTTPRKRG